MNHFLLHKQEEYKSVEHNIAQETDVRIKKQSFISSTYEKKAPVFSSKVRLFLLNKEQKSIELLVTCHSGK